MRILSILLFLAPMCACQLTFGRSNPNEVFEGPSLRLVETILSAAKKRDAQFLDVRLGKETKAVAMLMREEGEILLLNGLVTVRSIMSDKPKLLHSEVFENVREPIRGLVTESTGRPAQWEYLQSSANSEEVQEEFVLAIAPQKGMALLELNFVARVKRTERDGLRDLILWARSDGQNAITDSTPKSPSVWVRFGKLALLRETDRNTISDYLQVPLLDADMDGVIDQALSRFVTDDKSFIEFSDRIVFIIQEVENPVLLSSMLIKMKEYATRPGALRRYMQESNFSTVLGEAVSQSQRNDSESVAESIQRLEQVLLDTSIDRRFEATKRILMRAESISTQLADPKLDEQRKITLILELRQLRQVISEGTNQEVLALARGLEQ